MPQLHLYVPDDLAEEIRQRAESRGVSVSRLLSDLVRREVGCGWPEGFFERVVGGWQGEAPQRPSQGAFEERESF
ncbi:MAG: ribbon-helix-helix protein, CopG family [Gemmatimonadetes bacterium]|nr:ribbon-helix-helix protein, CopG family [Gemmatimonadota bacterium]